MVKVILHKASILDLEVDGLICSANVSLNLTGGVGADLICRYPKTDMQRELHALLEHREAHFARRGEVFECSSEHTPYKLILHAVATDPMYQSSIKTLSEIILLCLDKTAEASCRSVALTALATGFGNLELDDFAASLESLTQHDFPSIQELHLALIDEYRYDELKEALRKRIPELC